MQKVCSAQVQVRLARHFFSLKKELKKKLKINRCRKCVALKSKYASLAKGYHERVVFAKMNIDVQGAKVCTICHIIIHICHIIIHTMSHHTYHRCPGCKGVYTHPHTEGERGGERGRGGEGERERDAHTET